MKGRDGGRGCVSEVGRAEEGAWLDERWSSSSQRAGASSRVEASSRPHAATEANARGRLDEVKERVGRDGRSHRTCGRTELCRR